MAYDLIRLSQLTQVTDPVDTDAFVMGSGDTLKKIRYDTLKNKIGDSVNLAPPYDATRTYAIGDYCVYDFQLYRCTTNISSPEAWDGTHWTAMTLGGALEEISDTTKNLWLYGDQAIVNRATVAVYNVNLPPGTYTISALIKDNETSARNTRVTFYKGNVIATSNRLANPALPVHERSSATFTISETATIVLFQYGASQSLSGTCTWTDIQIEKGNHATAYVSPFTAVDVIAREKTKVYSDVQTLIGEHTAGTIQLNNYLPDSCQHPMVIVVDAMYTQTGTTAYPFLTTSVVTDRNLTRDSMRYKLGERDIYDIKSIRAIPYIWDNRPVSINITIPTGCVLTIRNIYCYFERSVNRTLEGVQFHAHDGAFNIAPVQTLSAYKMAFAANYNSGIVIPKISSDGVWFAYHDDTFDISTTNLRNPDGSAISSSEYDGMYLSQIPWSYLSQFIVGNYGSTFNDVHLMKLDDFLAFCAMTGMDPIFSMHPRYGIQTTETLTSLKQLVDKYNLLSKLIIKMPLVTDDNQYTLSNFTTIFGVFGNDIYGYEVGAVNGMNNPSSVVTLFNGVASGVTVHKAIEYWITQILADETLVSNAISNGYKVSCVCTSYTDVSGDTLGKFSSEAVKHLIGLGVTEFTDQYNTSNGLYW